MRAVVITSPGGPEVLSLTDVPDPVPSPGEVLIEVVAAGVNRADVLQRMGGYPPPPGTPPYPGLECSGRISAVGPGVTGWQAGDEVCALLAGGGYAERVAVPQGQLLPIPGGVSLVDAAGLPEAACTVHATVVSQAHLAAGETLLVHGGAGGIGTMAIQLAKSLGAQVACTAGTPAKLAFCTELGADLAISYVDDDFVAAVGSLTGGHGADVILDIMGGPYLARNLAALATGGRLVVLSTRGGARAEADLGLMMHKRASILASTLRARPPAEKAAIVAAVAEQVWPLVSAGQVRPVIEHVLPMADAAQAHRLLDAGAHIGKILLVSDTGTG
ncbi:MAG TPA: NAD(P)H-quinone oxidoreductase [Streptosporangiaceae bacterium]|nr:NAD(P)H-quinone oxidoreductase [Streptosporangiaceae bacterium]